jgi:RNA polymerase sigma-70 factor (ECF subfamily)
VHAHEGQLKSYIRGSFPAIRGEVEDVVQESYLRVWRSCASQPIRSAKAFLFSVARHIALDLMRRTRSSPLTPIGNLQELPDIYEGLDGAEVASLNEKMDILADALATLPPRCREIAILRKLKGVSQKDIAERLGISEKTVEEQAWRGVKRCEDYLRRRGVTGLFRA